MKTKALFATAAFALLPLQALPAAVLHVDAREPVAMPGPSPVPLGSSRAPGGETLGMNARFLTRNGHPWLPVMGEFHYVRVPADEWDRELARIKASGVDIVSTYLFWNYHEPVEGHFDWTGDRDLRRFVETAARHGLKVWLRLGPWVHAEVRYGGVPDWVVRAMPTRRNDPVYLAAVERFWDETARQLHGLLWKDGGPIIGVQLENEYNIGGPGGLAAHIAALKALALRVGFDVPFYSVTGWDNASYPRDQVVPVYGGYPDEPWGRTTEKLAPPEVYLFRFGSRVGGDLGAVTHGSAEAATPPAPETPFIGVEYGGGIPTMYRRRPVIAADDIGAMLPVQLGSGVNLYGYYMYHGGRNGVGTTTLEERTALGAWNDLPAIDYDFQAPFGEYDDANPALAAIRPFHLFLQGWGADLAPMAVRKPDIVPSGAGDLATFRYSVRSAGERGYLFFSNHVRQQAMPVQRGVQFKIDLPGGSLRFPDRPIDIPDGAYGIWPINLATATATIAWATVQPLTRLDTAEGPVTVFHAIPGVRASLAIRAAAVTSRAGMVRRAGDLWIVDDIRPGTGAVVEVRGTGGSRERFLVLSDAEAREATRLRLAGNDRLLITDADLIPGDDRVSLVSHGEPRLSMALFPAPHAVAGLPAGSTSRADGLFTRWEAKLPARSVPVALAPLRPARDVPPLARGGVADATLMPYPETWSSAAAWTITLPPHALDGLPDATLVIRWTGDMSRLFAGTTLLDDRFYDGRAWRVKLSRFAASLDRPLTLSVLPIRADAPIYLDQTAKRTIGPTAQVARLDSVRFEPDYQLDLSFGAAR